MPPNASAVDISTLGVAPRASGVGGLGDEVALVDADGRQGCPSTAVVGSRMATAHAG